MTHFFRITFSIHSELEFQWKLCLLQDSAIFKDPAQQPHNLQFLQTNILLANDCRSKFGQLIANQNDPIWLQIDSVLNETMLCTRNNVGVGICIGDSFFHSRDTIWLHIEPNSFIESWPFGISCFVHA